MDQARWRQVERLYHEARSRPPVERELFLAQACAGDAALRREVEALLEAPVTAEGFLGTGAIPRVHLTGRRLGVYEVHEQIGAGGMGEVYRARDTRLGRDVAIKILPAAFTIDPQRLARFEREARALAALNHPNIATIHGVEEAQDVRALVMELVPGDTLAERIARGPLKTADALAIATQIADALDAAHEKGIVHRDLKPANIKVTPSGAVKVLDFGLAKATDANVSDVPTMTTGGTAPGVIVGTAAYMSPEQARGLAVDKRTDIWAFGCVLYEMLTGRPAFGGPTISDVIAAILERAPDWAALPPATAPEIERLIKRALAKEQRDRLRDIADARFEISSALGGNREPRPVATPWRGTVWKSAAALVLVVGGAVGGRLWDAGPATQPDMPPISGSSTRLTSDAGLTIEPAISGDGRLIAYASDRRGDGDLDIWVQQATGGAAIQLTTDPANDRQPTVSPDGGLVAFRSDRNPSGVYVMPALGGDARLIAPGGMAPRFSPDGRQIAFWTGSWLAPRALGQARQTFVVPASGGDARRVAGNLDSAGDPAWSPDGRALIVFGRQHLSGDGTDPDFWWVPLDGRAPVATGVYERLSAFDVMLDDPNRYPFPLAWTESGVIFAAAGAGGGGDSNPRGLWRVGINRSTGRVTRDPVRLTSGTTMDTSAAVSRDGRMAFAAITERATLFVLPLDANAGRAMGEIRRVRDDTAPIGRPAASQDGSLIAFPRYEFGGGSVWIREMSTGRERQLVATPLTPLNPVISRDGRWVGYTVTLTDVGGNSGPGGGYLVDTNGGAPRKVCEDCQIYQIGGDNSQVIAVEGGARVTRIDLKRGVRTSVVTASPLSTEVDVAGELLDRPLLSPNDRWMVFNSGRKVFVAPIFQNRETPPQEWITVYERSGAERSAGVSPDGSLLYLLLERDGFRCLYAVRVDPETGKPAGEEPFLVHHFHDASRQWGSTGFGSATVTGMFLVELYETTGNIWMTTIPR